MQGAVCAKSTAVDDLSCAVCTESAVVDDSRCIAREEMSGVARFALHGLHSNACAFELREVDRREPEMVPIA